MNLDLSSYADLMTALAPELVLTAAGLGVLLLVAWRHRTVADLRAAGAATLAGLGAAAVTTWWLWWNGAHAVGIPAMIAADDFRFVSDWLLLGTAALTVLVSFHYLEREHLLAPEYYVLVLFATLGMMLMAGGEDLIVVFLGLELMSVCVYVLAGINRHSAPAAEAALKYFLLGAFASGFLLYGIALVYGATATTNLTLIGVQIRTLSLQSNAMLLIGLGLLLVGFGFKVAAVPFHMWAPDVYDGSPTPIAGYMATAVKAAAFAALFRVLGEAFAAVPAWHAIVWWLAVATMVVGTLIALALAVCMLSLLGFPVTAGFIGKWYILVAATSSGQVLLAAVLVLASVISAGYYLPVVMAMYMQPEPSADAHAGMRLGRLGSAVVAAAVAGLLFLGVRPNRLLDIDRKSTRLNSSHSQNSYAVFFLKKKKKIVT